MTTVMTPLERNVFLLGEAAGATLPDTYNCCTEDSMCRDHQDWQDAADLVAAIQDIAMNAVTVEEAGQGIAARLACGTGREITPAQQEFALGIIGKARDHTIACDDEGAKLRARYDDLKQRVRAARTYLELGAALAGDV